MQNKIIVFGGANVDFIIKSSRFPKAKGVVGDGVFSQMSGGTGVNHTVAIGKAGGKPIFIGALGTDIYADKLQLKMLEYGANTRHIFYKDDVSTGVAMIMVNEEGENMVSIAPGANAYLSVEDIQSIEDNIFEDVAYAVLQLEIPKKTAEYVIELCAKHQIPLLLNFSPVIDLAPSLFSKVSLVLINQREAELITGIKETDVLANLPKVVALLREKGFQKGVINIGKNGSYLFDQNMEKHIEGFKVEVLDTTAAGDAFCGNLVHKLVEGESYEESVRYANAAGAISVSRLGTLASLPTKDEVETFLKGKK